MQAHPSLRNGIVDILLHLVNARVASSLVFLYYLQISVSISTHGLTLKNSRTLKTRYSRTVRSPSMVALCQK